MKAARSLSEPPADMRILPSKLLACAPWRPPTSWQMGMKRAPLQPGVVEPRIILPRGTPHSAVSWVEGGGATVTRVCARDGPDIDKDAEKMLEQNHVRPLPSFGLVF